MDVSEADVYDVILTRAEIQEAMDMINAMVKKEIAAAKREASLYSSICSMIVVLYDRPSCYRGGQYFNTVWRSAATAQCTDEW